MDNRPSDAFSLFLSEAPALAEPWLEGIRKFGMASALDAKTQALGYLAVLAAQQLDSGIPFHVRAAREAGATREEIVSAILLGLPAAGNTVIGALPAALEAFDAPDHP